MALYCASSANEVHDQRNDGEEDQQVNRETADVHDKESAEPENDQNHCENQEHRLLLSETWISRLARIGTGSKSNQSAEMLLDAMNVCSTFSVQINLLASIRRTQLTSNAGP